MLQAPDGDAAGLRLDARPAAPGGAGADQEHAPTSTPGSTRAWCALPRPDLGAGFAPDPRFAGLHRRARRHARLRRARARRAPTQTDGAQVYLELVLDDGSCLFRPLAVTPFDSAERLPQVLQALSPPSRSSRASSRSISRRSSPSVPPRARCARRGARAGRSRSAAARPARDVAAIVPFRSFAAAAADARRCSPARPRPSALDLVLVAHARGRGRAR